MNSKPEAILRWAIVMSLWIVTALFNLSGCAWFVHWPCIGLCFHPHESSCFGLRNERIETAGGAEMTTNDEPLKRYYNSDKEKSEIDSEIGV